MNVLEFVSGLSPEQRIAVVGLLVGGIINGVKRWPKIPSQWVPLASLAMAALVSAGYFYVTNLTHVGMADYVLTAVLAGALPVAGHKFLKKPWAALLGEESADKWLGQADNAEPDDEDDKPKGPPSAALLVLCASLCPFLVGCGGSWAKVSNDALEGAAKGNNGLVATLNTIQDSARKSRKLIMKRVAETAKSKEQGLAALDAIDKKYEVVWVALAKAEKFQHALAEAIEVARAAIDAGRIPGIDGVLKLFAELQQAQAAVSLALAEVR